MSVKNNGRRVVELGAFGGIGAISRTVLGCMEGRLDAVKPKGF